MVGTAGVADGECGHAEVFEGLHPGFKDWSDGFVFLQVNAADLSAAVVHVEISGDLCLFRLHRNVSGFASQESGHALHPGIVHGRTSAEVILYVTLRAQQAFFFTAPQAYADRTPGFEVKRFQDANRFHHDDCSGAVIGGARTCVPGIEMRAQHYEFIFLVGARNFGNGVVLHSIVVVESTGNVEFEGHIFFLLQEPRDAGPVLGSHRQLGDRGGLAGFVGPSRLDEYRAAASSAAAVVDYGENLFIGEKLIQVLDELLALYEIGKAKAGTIGGNLIICELREIVVAQALVGSLGDWFYFGVSAQDDDQPRELSFVFVEIFFVVDGGANAFALHYAIGAGSPCLRIGEQRNHVGRGHADVDVLVGPAAAERSPRFKVRVGESHGSELVARPLVGALHVGGSSEALANGIHQSRGVVHHFGVVESFVADAAHGFKIYLFLGPQVRNR